MPELSHLRNSDETRKSGSRIERVCVQHEGEVFVEHAERGGEDSVAFVQGVGLNLGL